MMVSTIEQRKDQILNVLDILHNKGSFEEAKELFTKEFDNVDVLEITSAEKALIREGLDPKNIQELCKIHVAAFDGSMEDIHKSGGAYSDPSHPVYIFNLENQVLKSLVTDEIDDLIKKNDEHDWRQKERLINSIKDLRQVDKHYRRKEQLIFSSLEKYDNNEPPEVMQSADDKIRQEIEDLVAYVSTPEVHYENLLKKWQQVKNDLEKMIVQEEEFMIPKLLETFTSEDWEKISRDSFPIGFSYIPEPTVWTSYETPKNLFTQEPVEEFPADTIEFATGKLTPEQLDTMLAVLPCSLTFFDEKDYVRFFSAGSRPVFPRSQTDIGRKAVYLPGVADLKEVLAAFHEGKKSQADFSITKEDKHFRIYYYALKDTSNQYIGCVEFMEDLK